VSFLLSNNADVNHQNIDLDSPLHYHAKFCNDNEQYRNIANALLLKGANINAQDKNKWNWSIKILHFILQVD